MTYALKNMLHCSLYIHNHLIVTLTGIVRSFPFIQNPLAANNFFSVMAVIFATEANNKDTSVL